MDHRGAAGRNRFAGADDDVDDRELGCTDRGFERKVGRCVGGIRGGDHPTRLDHERQRVTGLDHRSAGRVVAVRELGGNVELAPRTDLDPDQALVPSLDDPSLAERKVVRDAAFVAVVELDTVDGAHAHVVDHDGVADCRGVPGAGHEVGDLQLGRDLGRHGNDRLGSAREGRRRVPRDQLHVLDRRSTDSSGGCCGAAVPSSAVPSPHDGERERGDDSESEGGAHRADATGGRPSPARERCGRRRTRSPAAASVRTGRRG